MSFEEEPGGERPDRLCEVRPQDRVLRRTVDQIVDAVQGLPALDVPVPQMVDQPLALLAAFDFLVPEQVIEVHSWWKPRRSCLSLRLSGRLSSRPLTFQFRVVVLVEVFTVYTQVRVQQRLVEQIIVFQQRLPSKSFTFQFCLVHLTIFIKILFPQLVLPICWIRQINGFFELFFSKCEDPAHPGVGTWRGLQLMASVSLAGGGAGWLH